MIPTFLFPFVLSYISYASVMMLNVRTINALGNITEKSCMFQRFQLKKFTDVQDVTILQFTKKNRIYTTPNGEKEGKAPRYLYVNIICNKN